LSHRKKALFGFVALLRRRWKTALSLFAVVTGLGAFADNLGKILGLGESILHWLNPCPLQANITEEIRTRIYFRGSLGPEMCRDGEFIHQPNAQELFYQWQLHLIAEKPLKNIAVKIQPSRNTDRISVTPEYGRLSDLVPKWWSGFPEPHRSQPDYYARTISFDYLGAGLPGALIAIRRPLAAPNIPPDDTIRVVELASAECFTAQPTHKSPDLQKQARELTAWAERSGIRGVPIRDDPGDVGPNEMQATNEARCLTEQCDKISVSQLEVHLGKSPQQYCQDLRAEQVASTAEAVFKVLGCVEGPYCFVSKDNPDAVSYGFNMCPDDEVNIISEKGMKLLAVLESSGATVDVSPGKRETE